MWWSQLTLEKEQGTKTRHFRVHQSAPSAVLLLARPMGVGKKIILVTFKVGRPTTATSLTVAACHHLNHFLTLTHPTILSIAIAEDDDQHPTAAPPLFLRRCDTSHAMTSPCTTRFRGVAMAAHRRAALPTSSDAVL